MVYRRQVHHSIMMNVPPTGGEVITVLVLQKVPDFDDRRGASERAVDK